jgi:hypothetical protein
MAYYWTPAEEKVWEGSNLRMHTVELRKAGQPSAGGFLCVLTRFTGSICRIQRKYHVSGSFTRHFPPPTYRISTVPLNASWGSRSGETPRSYSRWNNAHSGPSLQTKDALDEKPATGRARNCTFRLPHIRLWHGDDESRMRDVGPSCAVAMSDMAAPADSFFRPSPFQSIAAYHLLWIFIQVTTLKSTPLNRTCPYAD